MHGKCVTNSMHDISEQRTRIVGCLLTNKHELYRRHLKGLSLSISLYVSLYLLLSNGGIILYGTGSHGFSQLSFPHETIS